LARLTVRVQPGAARDEIIVEGDALRVRLTAAPVEGRANKRLIELLAKRLGVPRSGIQLVHGQAARTKLLDIESLELADIIAKIGA